MQASDWLILKKAEMFVWSDQTRRGGAPQERGAPEERGAEGEVAGGVLQKNFNFKRQMVQSGAIW